MTVKEIIKQQIIGALKEASFPINTPTDLLEAFPEGAATTCRAGDLAMTAGEAGKLLTASDFPFTSATAVAETIVTRAKL